MEKKNPLDVKFPPLQISVLISHQENGVGGVQGD